MESDAGNSMSLLEVFFGHSKEHPDAVAVRFGQQAITYAELAARSFAIGAALRKMGVCPDTVVGLHARRSIEYISGLLGIFASGGACLPLDPSYPTARLRQMSTDSGAALVLRGDKDGDPLDPDILEVGIEELAKRRCLDPPAAGVPHDRHLAYVLYTSGSTGTPKGVAMEHGPLRRLIEWQLAQDEGAGSATLQFAQLGFDVAFQEILSTLCGGGSLVIAGEHERRDPAELMHLVARTSIDRLFLPTAFLPLFAEAARKDPPVTLRRIYVAGEALKITPAIREFMTQAPWCSLHNHYGPTETHVVTSHTLPSDPATWPALPPIGKALPHARILLRDAAGCPVPRGAVGEICIGGQCLARGYIGDRELTSGRFFIDPTSGVQIYRTGDLGCELDGLLHYRGRLDRQVKIRGYRVEPDEVEVALARQENVSEAAVITEDDAGGNPQLVAYVVLREPALSLAACRSFLRERLPEFMVPSIWFEVPALARTPSGKIDRRALKERLRQDRRESAPLSSLTTAEQRVTEIWCRVLPSSTIGVDDKFFDAGGNSLLFVYVQGALQAELGIAVPITALYENPTIRLLARWIESRTGGAPAIAEMRSAGPRARDGHAIAIVGVACRFPGASGPAQFWSNLCEGVDSIERAAPTDGGGSVFVRAAGKLSDIEAFDAAFFGFSKRDAELLDPQHRLFLECAQEALEDAAIDSRRLGGRIGVFGGCGPSTYLINNLLPTLGGEGARSLISSVADLQLLIANDKDYLTSQVAYRLDLTGPSLNVNAACATALAAVHFACRSLLAGDCDAALAGAANIPVPQLDGYVHEPGMMFSPDGYCRAFDEKAAGAVFASGVGVVALRRLDDALREGDDIYAVIRGSAFANDGGLKAGFTAPSENGQARVIREALESAGIEPNRIGFIEGHGTATSVGDAIEVAALRRVFGADGARKRVLGSVKTNIGHLGWAAGMAGLLKTVLALHYRKIPPTLHFSRPNPALQLEASGFFVNTGAPCDWPTAVAPLCAGVSAFGLGGNSAHVVIEEAPARPVFESAPQGICTVPLSAHGADALAALGASYAAHLEAHPEIGPADIALTASTGRRHHAVRRALVASTRDGLIGQLKSIGLQHRAASSPASTRIAGLFTGQGAERVGMGQQLYVAEPVFREVMDRANAQMLSERGLDLLSWLFDGPADDFSAHIDRIQPAVFAIEMALVALWRSWGVRFDATMGHSLGEFAAAAAAGVFGFEDGLRLVAERGRLLKSLSDDAAMAVVFADEPSVRATISRFAMRTWVAAVNSTYNTVISGTKADVADACANFIAEGLEARLISVSRAGHSALMEPIRAAFEAAAARIPMQPPQIDLVSNVTGALADGEITKPQYWGRHLCETVRFAAGLDTIARRGVGAFIEVGAAPHLIGISEACLPDLGAAWVASMRPGEDENEVLARGVASLYEAGFDLDWTSLQGTAGRRVHLPVYPFQRSRYWIDAPLRACTEPATGPARPSEAVEGGLTYQVDWHSILVPARHSPQVTDGGHWLLFADQGGLARAVAAEARAGNIGVTLVTAGECCGWISEDEFALRLGSSSDLARLFAAHSGKDVTRIVSLWNLDARPPVAGNPDDDLLKLARQSLELAVLLGQKTATDAGRPAALTFVTRGAQRVHDVDDAVDPLQSAIWGFARTAALERPDGQFARIDIALSGEVDPGLFLAALASGDREPELALRDGRLFASRLVAKAPPAVAMVSLDPMGSYLITGGLGGLGLWSAQQLARYGARRLILVGRSAPTSRALATIEDMRELGVKVAIVEADVAAPAVAIGLFEDAERNGAPIRGIIHCAGVIDDDTIDRQSWARIEAVLRPKMQGAWNLHTAAASHGSGLEFFLLQSSATSVLGNFGQAGHGAACAFLDGLAQYRRLRRETAVSVNWGAWSNVGYLMSRPEVVEQLERRGMGSIAAATGARFLPAMLSSSESQWAILPNDWNIYLDLQNRASDPFFAKVGADSNPGNAEDVPVARQLARAVPQMRRAVLLTFLLGETQRLLGAHVLAGGAELDADCPLRDLGLDSLGAIQLRNILQSRLKVPLPPRVVYQHPTINALTDHLMQNVVTDAWCKAMSGRIPDEASPGLLATAERVPENETVRLSVQQRRWLRLIRDNDYGQRIVPIVFHAALDRRAFIGALRCVVGRHDVLRYVFPEDKALLLAPDELVLTSEELFADIRGLSQEARLVEISRQIDLCRGALGDPTNHPSWTVRCLDSTPSQFVVLLGLQHLAFDGTSLSVFVDELREAYLAETAGRTPNLSTVTQYCEYGEQQHAFMEGGITAERPFFEGLYAALERTTALARHPGFATTRARPSQRFTAEAPLANWNELSDAARRRGLSPFALIMSSYATLVAELVSSAQVVIGVIASGRGDARFNKTIGPFTSPFPVPITLGRDPAILAGRIDRLMASITARSMYPAVDLINHVEAFKGFPLDTYFTDTCINFLNYRREERSPTLPVEVLEVLGPVSHPEFANCGFDQLRRIPGLHLVAEVTAGMLRANYWYHTERFGAGEIGEWAARHRVIMANVLASC